MPTDNFSAFRRKIRIPPGWQKPCKAAQWGDGVLAANLSHTPDDPMYGPYYFSDLPIGVVRDGLGGAFVLSASQTAFEWAQGPIVLRPISATGKSGPLISTGGNPAWYVGVLGPWTDGAIVPSGSGSCIVAWTLDWGASPEVSVQRYDQAGTALWNAGKQVNASTKSWSAYSVCLVAEPDGSDGVILAWFRLDWQNYIYTLHTQRLSASGNKVWSPDGVALGTVEGPFGWRAAAPWTQLVPDGSGGAFVLSIEGTNNCVVYRLDANGTIVGSPVALLTQPRDAWIGSHRIRRAVSDGAGGFYLGFVDAINQLRVLRYSPTAGTLWTVTLDLPIKASAYHMREDDRGGLLITFIKSPSQLQLVRLDANGNITWSVTPIQISIPMGPSTWTSDYWSRLAQAVPDGNGGALLVFQDWPNGRTTPELHSICFDSTGMPVSPAQKISARATTQEYPIASAVGPLGAVVAWADNITGVNNTDVFAQRFGCCPPSTFGLEPWPPFGCEIIQFPGVGFNQMLLQFPCGNRDRQIGVLPLTRLFSNVRGLDFPGSMFNSDVQPPNWMRVIFSDLPDGTNVQLYSIKGKLIADSKSIPGDRDNTTRMRYLTFKPSAKDDQLLVFSNENKFEPDSTFPVRVQSEWGDGKPTEVSAPLNFSKINERAKLTTERKSRKSNRVRKRRPKT